MSDTYVPVACAIHDQYERAILRRLSLFARWQETDGWHDGMIRPVAVETLAGEEFLTFQVDGRTHRIRLDHIHLPRLPR